MALAAIVVMYAAFIGIGWLASRRSAGGIKGAEADDFMVAGRAMPVSLATFTMTATWVDGGYLLGTAEGAYRSSIASGLQGGVCFGISLIIGGLFFARRMREREYHTLIDPFEARFGARWALVLALPAVLAEMFWSAELLVALGSTFGVVLDLNLATGIVLSAVVVTFYTMAGGMWAVAYTDAFQLLLVGIGLAAALPFALSAAGGLSHAWAVYQAAPHAPSFSTMGWWDVSMMLMLGGVPWNCYFQRVLSCRSPRAAQAHSILSGLLTIVLTIPPLLIGLVAFAYVWPPALADRLAAQPADAMPMIFRYVTPGIVGLLGLAAIVGAVTSSFSSSILSAGSMFAWNVYQRLIQPGTPVSRLTLVMRVAILLIGIGAVWMALEVQSVQALWFFTSDLVFVLLFPQLVYALYDPKANLAGSMAAFFVSLILRLGGGEPLFGMAALIPYPEWLPFKTVAAAAGMILLPLVSRVTAAARSAATSPD
ncbi:MAG: sodium:solute symporter family protein [Cyanobacteria bacterium]|nr:sodium:solute symporter family protein [Cyanobacteriota bacterium]